jgi:hypothetical protein
MHAQHRHPGDLAPQELKDDKHHPVPSPVRYPFLKSLDAVITADVTDGRMLNVA